MKASFDLLHTTRERLRSLATSLEWSQVNIVPKGYTNSLAWNLAHVIVTQQLLHYGLSGREMLLDQVFIDKYRKGTRFETPMSQDDWANCIQLLQSLAEELERDYYAGKFVHFQQYPTSYGYELNSIEEAIQFNNIHEALHLGYMMSMRKALSGQ